MTLDVTREAGLLRSSVCGDFGTCCAIFVSRLKIRRCMQAPHPTVFDRQTNRQYSFIDPIIGARHA
ncbi:hypothetical protein [Caballeronia hypogeia]|uniref:hypothetical protein n=1 Tax=Caballeronia hypogeia TaxID=1777140 RepID=UPI0012FD5B94|nr:hypothetical protein [Caballeronia hypogeia]